MQTYHPIAIHLPPPTFRLTLLLAAALAATGCARRVTPVEEGNRAQALHLGNLSEPRDLDPHIVTGVTENNLLSALLEGLAGEDPVDLHPVPAAAERWDLSPDGLVYTFHLRADARWSNGDPVTAGDFVFSFQRMLSPALGAAYAYMLYGLTNAEAFHAGRVTDFGAVGAAAPDPRTLRLTLHHPIPYFLSLLSHSAWLPVHPPTILRFGRIDQMGTAWTRAGNFVGNGPFTLAAWEPGRKIVAAKSPTYWDRDRVRLNAIHFHPIGDAAIEERAFRAGQLHVTGTVPIDRIAYYQRERPDVLRLAPYLGTYYYLFNVRKPPLNDPRVRRALALAVDRDRIVASITRGGEAPARGFTPPGTAGYTARAGLPGGIAEARQLLAAAGFPGGRGFPRLELLFNTADAHERIAQAVQQMWKTGLGIDVQLVNMEWKVYLARTQGGEYDIARAGWIGDYVDPNTFLDVFLTDGGNNRTGWSSPAYDALIAEAGRTADPAARMECFQNAERILMDELPFIPFYFYRSKALVQPSVRNWNPTLLDHHPYKHVWLDASAPGSSRPAGSS